MRKSPSRGHRPSEPDETPAVQLSEIRLVTFRVDHERAVRMASVIPDHAVKVAESGVRGVEDARSLRAAGYHAVLVGETLVTSGDPAAEVTALTSA